MKNFIYVILEFIGIVRILGIWTVNATTITHYTGSNISYTLNSWFTTEKLFTWVWTITISDCEGGQTEDCTTITIFDRNLWATVAGTGWSDSYWYHFQWWNNYWFKPCISENCKDFPNGESTWTIQTQVENISIPYTNPIFYVNPTWKTNWLNDASKVDMWWWTANSTTDLFNNIGGQINFENIESISDYTSSDSRKVKNAPERQWPCPDWWHVPSIWEYIKILDMLGYSNYQRQRTWTREFMHYRLNIPFAGWRFGSSPILWSASVQGLGDGALLRSSSPYSISIEQQNSRAITIIDEDSDRNLGWFDTYRSDAFSVRCFYNGYDGYPKEIKNINITWIVEPLIWQQPVTRLINVNTTPDNAITLWSPGYETSTIIWWHAPGFAQTLDNYRIWGAWHETFSSTSWYYYLRVIFTENSWYKVSDDVNVTANGKNLIRNVDFIGQTGKWYADFYAIKIYYPASELPIGIERVYLSWNILPLVHWTVPTKDITTDTTWVTLWNITWWKWNNCEPLAENETIDASISKYCLSIDMVTESWYATTFDYEIFLNNGHRIGYRDGDNAYACTPLLIKNKNIIPQYKIEFISSWETIGTRYRAYGCTLANCITYGDGLRIPNRSWYSFDWWFVDKNFNIEWNWNEDQVVNNVKLYAKWTDDTNTWWIWGWSSSIWGYSWWGKYITTLTDNEDTHNFADENNYPEEFKNAYDFAYKNEITTMDTIDKADMEGWITRIAMAKMLSNYAINLLWKKPANIVVPKFSDVTSNLNEEYDYWVTLAYQLWIMWINIDKFRPLDMVTRAEFGTALSRMLFGTEDGNPYYITHLAKLKKEWIMTNIDPEMIEIRWYVMIMLMRSTNKN